MKFASLPWLLLLLPVVPACIWFVTWGIRRRRQSLDRIVAPRLHQQLLRSVNYARRRQKQILFIAAVALLLLALARPLGGNREVKVELPGIDCFIALDVSRSMLAEDAGTTNRITAAKEALIKLLERPAGDRVGLIVFAGDAFLVSPITQDHGSIERTIKAMTTTSVSKPGTDIAAAIKLAAKSFETKQEAGKAVLIITDGEELQGDAILSAREAVTQKIAIFAVGVGTAAGARIPDRPDNQLKFGQNDFGRDPASARSDGPLKFAKNEFGRDVVSRLNERVLQQIATAGRGRYAALGLKGEGLDDIYDRGMKLLSKGTHLRQSKDMTEFFQIPLGLCLALLFWELLVNERRKH